MKQKNIEYIVNASMALSTLVSATPELASLNAEHCIKALDDRAVFRGQFEGRDVVVKIALSAKRRAMAQNHAKALITMRGTMLSGPYRIPELIADFSDKGVLVTEEIQGKTIGDTLLKCDANTRQAMLNGAAGWLNHFTRSKRSMGHISVGYWQGVLQNARANPKVSIQLIDTLMRLINLAELHLGLLKEVAVTRAYSHGDFHAQNLIHADGIFWGIDLEVVKEHPLCAEVSEFLSRLPIQPSATIDPSFGASLGDVKTFIDAGLISEAEARATLPFFMTMRLVKKLMQKPKSNPQSPFVSHCNAYLRAMT